MNHSFIPPGSCDDITLRVQLIGGNPGRLSYTWSASLADGETALNGDMTTMLNNLNGVLSGLASDTIQYTIKSNISAFIGKKITVSVSVKNFLGTTKNGSMTFLRESKQLPQAVIPNKEITSLVSRAITLRGNMSIIFLDE